MKTGLQKTGLQSAWALALSLGVLLAAQAQPADSTGAGRAISAQGTISSSSGTTGTYSPPPPQVVGAQGGDAQATVRAAWRGTEQHTSGPIAVNASRSIIYASSGADFAQAARHEAIALRLSLQAARVFSA